jgi:hypothetical protein
VTVTVDDLDAMFRDIETSPGTQPLTVEAFRDASETLQRSARRTVPQCARCQSRGGYVVVGDPGLCREPTCADMGACLSTIYAAVMAAQQCAHGSPTLLAMLDDVSVRIDQALDVWAGDLVPPPDEEEPSE